MFEESYELRENIVYRVMGGEAIILDVVSGEHFDLNLTGTEIFLGIAEKKKLDSVMKMQKKRYAEDELNLKKDIQGLVSELLEKQIIRKQT